MLKADIERLEKLALERLEDGPERQALLANADLSELPKALLDPDEDEQDEQSLQKKAQINLRDLSIPQRIKLAMFGNKAARIGLLRDPNRMVQLFVLDNPRISDGEVCDVAKNTNVDEAVLRAVANNSQWMKGYTMKLLVCNNPKMPVDVTLKWFKFLTDKDLVNLSRSKNVPQVLASQARKLSEKRMKKNSGGDH